ncbi:hypothetical protein F5Y12DRAFT_188741 [Xylaria sp. FL1777]|nr:hypothetical protein F5Y12DRAFT_188741 [Xylaria sp. FL1777]
MGNWLHFRVCVVLLQHTTVAANMLYAVILTAQACCHYLSWTNDATCVYRIGSFGSLRLCFIVDGCPYLAG